MELRHTHPRQQGDVGEAIALNWLIQAGYGVWLPFGHSPDCDLIAEHDGKLSRVQVKTSTHYRNSRWVVAICTRGGNRSWNGVVKRFERSRYEYLFVVVGDWRCWFIPSTEIEAGSSISLGGAKYASFEVEAPRLFEERAIRAAVPA